MRWGDSLIVFLYDVFVPAIPIASERKRNARGGRKVYTMCLWLNGYNKFHPLRGGRKFRFLFCLN